MGTSGGLLLWTRPWTLWFHKGYGNFWSAELLSDSELRICTVGKAMLVCCAGERIEALSTQGRVVQRPEQHDVDELQPLLLRSDHHCARQLQRGRQQPPHFGKQITASTSQIPFLFQRFTREGRVRETWHPCVFLAYLPYFQKMKVNLRDQFAVSASVSVSPPTT
jgi:hypothetical protein